MRIALRALAQPTHTPPTRALAIAAEMEARAKALVAKQEAVVVPVVAAYLPAKEQKRFNNKVRSVCGST